MFSNRLYGIRVRCEQLLYPEPEHHGAGAPERDAVVELLQLSVEHSRDSLTEEHNLFSSHEREVNLCTDRPLAESLAGQPWCLEVEGVVSFHWRGGESEVRYTEGELGQWRLTAFWFVHIFLPLYLALERNYDFIHCSAVEIDERPVLFIAPSTGGKSTLADYFLQRGHTLLTDDKAGTFLYEGEYHVTPSHPHHRPYRKSEVLGDRVEKFASETKPILAFYLLEQGEPDGAVAITEITGFRKFEELIPNYLHGFHFLQERRLRWLASLADQARVFRLQRPWNLARMDEVYAAVCGHARGLQNDASQVCEFTQFSSFLNIG